MGSPSPHPFRDHSVHRDDSCRAASAGNALVGLLFLGVLAALFSPHDRGHSRGMAPLPPPAPPLPPPVLPALLASCSARPPSASVATSARAAARADRITEYCVLALMFLAAGVLLALVLNAASRPSSTAVTPPPRPGPAASRMAYERVPRAVVGAFLHHSETGVATDDPARNKMTRLPRKRLAKEGGHPQSEAPPSDPSRVSRMRALRPTPAQHVWRMLRRTNCFPNPGISQYRVATGSTPVPSRSSSWARPQIWPTSTSSWVNIRKSKVRSREAGGARCTSSSWRTRRSSSGAEKAFRSSSLSTPRSRLRVSTSSATSGGCVEDPERHGANRIANRCPLHRMGAARPGSV
jgi:hypothetical protein